MSQGHPSADPASLVDRVRSTMARSRQVAADVGATEEAIAAVEDGVAATYERMAESDGPRAVGLRAAAARAREHADQARQVAERERRTGADQDERGRHPIGARAGCMNRSSWSDTIEQDPVRPI
jgi:hypothetical protein